MTPYFSRLKARAAWSASLVLVWSSVLAGTQPEPFPPPPATMPDAVTHIYKEIDGFKLPIYVFSPTGQGDAPPPPRTAIVYFHGSGWESGTVLQFAGHARLLARHGIVAALAEYRIKVTYNGTPFDSVADAKSAIRWLRQNAAKLGIDPHRIVAAGGSAGGHLAACAAIFPGKFDDPQDDQAVSARPDALVLFAPMIDTTPETGYKETVPLFKGRARELSPVHHLVGGLPPAIIFHGTADRWITLESIERFSAGLLAAGNECRLVRFEGRSHFFYNHPDYFELRPGMKDYDSPNDFAPTFYLIEQFLADHGFMAQPSLFLKIP